MKNCENEVKDDEGNIVYESGVALAKVTLPGVENSEIEAYKKTLEKQNEKIRREAAEKMNLLSNEIFESINKSKYFLDSNLTGSNSKFVTITVGIFIDSVSR